MIHPHTEVRLIDEEIGRGVFATAFIPRGTITWVGDGLDREFTPAEVAAFDPVHREILDRYSYRTAVGDYFFCWDHTRYMNHSFRPTCLPTAYGVEIAVRDIAAGEELTNDYGCLNIIETFTPRGEAGEDGRREVRPDDLARYHPRWDARIAAAITFLTEVDQPLAYLIEAGTLQALRDAAAGRTTMRSIRELALRG